ncbi:hypothetical protein IU485_27815 [Nocardia cyriacigeorgica]|uniref:hypothetical protein n=1 Tax=Nocardia cyriacigeorgica TaxID=135487 RepID=UPI00189587AD|nr:hypothetical protein [Nocardia cyriacigeorgica]MBF6085185.1 hypothetical protein [Nocardia cyriacigeorgica]
MTTQQESEQFIFGSNIPREYVWWVSFDRDWEYDSNDEAPDGWVYSVSYLDPDDEDEERVLKKDIRHADLMRAARKIIDKDFVVNPDIRKEAQLMIFNPDECDIDAGAADCILQVAVLGDIVYG